MSEPIRPVAPSWRAAVLVCRNQRPPGAEKSSCGLERGTELRGWLKARSRQDGLKGDLVVVETSCLGVCSPLGVTVAAVPPIESGRPRQLWVVPDGADREELWAEIRRALEL
jgi:hypothetical protein